MGKRRVVVFGIFDGVHEGHKKLFEQALCHGEELIVIVGRDSVSLQLKGKTPKFTEEERVALLSKEPFVSRALLGDRGLSTYRVLEELKPDVICLGYDQHKLKEDLLLWIQKNKQRIELVELESYKPEIFHNSKLQM